MRRLVAVVLAVALIVPPIAAAPAVGAQSSLPPGERLQGVVGVQEAEVEGEFASRAFQVAFATAATNASRAAAVADQVTDLRERLDRLERRRDRLRAALENGSITRGEFEAEMAAVAVRAANARRLANETARAGRRVPADALRERGVSLDGIETLRRNAANLTGPEAAAIARSVAGRGAGSPIARGNPPGRAGPPDGRQAPGKRGQGGPPNRSASLDVAASGFALGSLAAQGGSDAPIFRVALDRDGSARVTMTLSFDLTTDSERRAFATLRTDDQGRADVRSRFQARLRSVANQSEDRTGRAMRVHDATIDLSTTDDNETGIVRLGVAWEGLAAVSEAHLVITEPFASGFTPDRPFVVRIAAPSGYRLTSAAPAPEARDEERARWAAGTTLTGFTVVFSPANRTPLPTEAVEEFRSTATPTTGGNAPGFGAVPAALAVALAAVARRRLR